MDMFTSYGHNNIQYPILYCFWKHVQRKKTAQKTQYFKKKKEIRAGAWPTHSLPSFSRIFGIIST